jgi:hypothetical protein
MATENGDASPCATRRHEVTMPPASGPPDLMPNEARDPAPSAADGGEAAAGGDAATRGGREVAALGNPSGQNEETDAGQVVSAAEQPGESGGCGGQNAGPDFPTGIRIVTTSMDRRVLFWQAPVGPNGAVSFSASKVGPLV